MINVIQTRKNDIKRVIKNLDITPSMFKNAEEKYKNIAEYLNENGLKVDISLQGSFAIGAAVKPYTADGEDKSYDVDVICLFKECELSSNAIRDNLVKVLNASETYQKMIHECPKCFTLEYASIGNYDFSIDLVPSVIDDNHDIVNPRVDMRYFDYVFKIAMEDDWYTINPKGYQQWFKDINNRFALYNRENRMKMLFEANKDVYASVEEIPEYFNKSSLQEAIQILKRSRDVYFSKIKRENNKPSSIILTTLAAMISVDMPTGIDSVDLAYEVMKKINLIGDSGCISKLNLSFGKNGGKWEFYNPVNSKDNLLDSWNTDSNDNDSKVFFEWIKHSLNDFDLILDDKNANHLNTLGNCFGNPIVDKLFERVPAEKVSSGVKPYHE